MKRLLDISRYEKSIAKKDDKLARVFPSGRLMSAYDDFSTGSDGSGGGDALATILQTVGAAATTAGTVYAAQQYGTPTPYPTPVNTNISAHATALPMGSTTLLWVFVLVVVGFFAFKKL